MRLFLLVLMLEVIVWCSIIQPLASGQDAVKSVKEDAKSLYTAGYLLQLGSELKSPLLRLLGLTLCNVHTWSVWGEWSACSAKISGTFGRRNRTRILGIQDKRCPLKENPVLETDTSLCEGLCVSGFNLTKHGYCVKYIPEKVHYNVAEKRCAEDGAHVININSDQKVQDLMNMYVSFITFFWVDGQRASVGSPWMFSEGVKGVKPDVLNWNSGQPNNGTTELCLVYHYTDWRLHDAICTITPLGTARIRIIPGMSANMINIILPPFWSQGFLGGEDRCASRMRIAPSSLGHGTTDWSH